MQWIVANKENLPAQGLKVLCFKKGDCWVAYRFSYQGENIWLPCMPHGSFSRKQKPISKCDSPEYWCPIPFEQLPGDYKGTLLVEIKNDPEWKTIDEFEKSHPEGHAKFVQTLTSNFKNIRT